MPATSLFGCRLRQLSSDNTFFYFLIAVVQIVWLFIYWIGIAAFSRPQACDPGTTASGQQWAVTFSCLGLFIAQALLCCAAVLISLRGSPLQPSKRRWLAPVTYAYLLSLPIAAGLLAWACWVVNAGDGSCWSSGNKAMPNSIFFGGYGVLLGQLVGVLVSYNQLSDVKPGVWWHGSRRAVGPLIHLLSNLRQQHRGPSAQLEELAAALQKQLAGIEADKTDTVAALACAALLQKEAVAAAAAAAAALQPNGQPAGMGASASGNAGSTAAGNSKATAELQAWTQGVCCSAGRASSEVLAREADPAATEAAAEALHWALFPAAAYGARLSLWQRGRRSARSVRRELARKAAALLASGEAQLASMAAAPGENAPSKAAVQDFVAATSVLSPAGCEVVHFCAGDRKRGLLPHVVAVDKQRQAVVLGIAGDWSQPHAVPVVKPAPPGWLPGSSSSSADSGAATAVEGAAAVGCKQDGPGSGSTLSSRSWVHGPSLEAAGLLLEQLESSQVLRQLLQPSSPDMTGTGAASMVADCSGWQLVLSGHGTGAGAAALLALKLQHITAGGLAVWAYGCPGQLCSPDLATALGACCRLTSVAVGDDAAPRASAAALQLLVEQALVGLARLRYCKAGLLAGLVAERLGPRRWEGRWVNPARALRPLSEVPAEAWAYLQRYRDWHAEQQQQQQQQQNSPSFSALPGRVLLLFRQQAVPAAANKHTGQASSQEKAPGDSIPVIADGSSSTSSNGASTASNWQAGWLMGEHLASCGVRVSRHTLVDHRMSRLLGVLGDLAAASSSGRASHQPTAANV